MVSMVQPTPSDHGSSLSSSGFTIQEVVDRWNVGMNFTKTPDATAEHTVNDRALPQVAEVTTFVTRHPAFSWLISQIRRITSTTATTSTSFQSVAQTFEILLTPCRSFHVVEITVQWDPVLFLHEQYGSSEPSLLPDVITLTSQDERVQVATCAQYMEQIWSASGTRALEMLQLALSRPPADCKCKGCTCNVTVLTMIDSLGPATVRIELDSEAHHLVATIGGPAYAIIEFAEQLSWLGAACRSSVFDDRLCRTIPTVQAQDRASTGSVRHAVLITYERVPVLESDSSPGIGSHDCWQALFRNPSVAHGFPLSRRHGHEQGAEIPLNMMIALGQAEMVVNYDGHTLIKGFSSVFKATSVTEHSVIWHFATSLDGSGIGSYMTYQDAIFDMNDPNNGEITSLACKRHFVGWTSSACSLLGRS